MIPTRANRLEHLRGGALALAAWACLLAAMTSCREGNFTKASTAQVYVSSKPDGAMLFLDSNPCGTTPATLSSVPAGEHLLSIRKQGYREARMSLSIKPGERVAVEQNLEPVRGLVLIHSVPEGADVEMDNVSIGKTPMFSHDFPTGEKRLQISKPGYLPKSVIVNTEDRTPQKVEVTLTPDSAELILESSPPGAMVLLDDSAAGTTPCRLSSVKTGKHVLEFSLKGHENTRLDVTLAAGDRRKLSPSLHPLPGKLTVISRPPGARVYFNNQVRGETPIIATNVPSGRYLIRAESRGFDPQVQTGTVVYGEETTVEFNLVKSSGTLLVSTMPANVEIFLDGESRGETRQGAGQVSEQLRIDFIPKGEHTLQFSKQGYHDAQRTVEIMPKQTVIVHEKLVLRPVPFVPDVVIRTGDGPEHSFKGIVRERYANGDIYVEITPGIFRTFKREDIVAIESIPPPGPGK